MLQKKAGLLLLFIHVKNQYVRMSFFLNDSCYSKSSCLAMNFELLFQFFFLFIEYIKRCCQWWPPCPLWQKGIVVLGVPTTKPPMWWPPLCGTLAVAALIYGGRHIKNDKQTRFLPSV